MDLESPVGIYVRHPTPMRWPIHLVTSDSNQTTELAPMEIYLLGELTRCHPSVDGRATDAYAIQDFRDA